MELKLIQLPKFEDPRGNLTYLENYQQIPFEIARVFWTYDVPGEQKRGGHAYKSQTELIIALSGSFDIVFTDKKGKVEKISLNRPYFGVIIQPNIWRHLENFSTNSLSLHLSDSKYDESDYIRNFSDYSNDN